MHDLMEASIYSYHKIPQPSNQLPNINMIPWSQCECCIFSMSVTYTGWAEGGIMVHTQ